MVTKSTGMLSLSPERPRHEERENVAFITKAGYLVMSFFPVKKVVLEEPGRDKRKGLYDFNSERRYYLTARDIGLLLISPFDHNNKKALKHEQEYSRIKFVEIERHPTKNKLLFTYKEAPDYSIKVSMKFSELIVMQRLIEFAVPHLYGWSHFETIETQPTQLI